MAAPGVGQSHEMGSETVGATRTTTQLHRLTYSSLQHIIREPGGKNQEELGVDCDLDEGRSLRRRPLALPPQSAAVVRRTNDLQYHDNSFNSIGAGRCAPAACGAKWSSQVSSTQVPDKRRGSGAGGGNGRRPQSEQERLRQRSHSSKQQQQKLASNNNNGSQHHYDYCTDSDLVSTPAIQAHHFGSNTNFRADNFNYDQNILLFATEHGATSGGPQPVAPTGHSNSKSHLNLNSNSNSNQNPNSSSGGRKPATNRGLQLGATGKFVSHYPTYASPTQPSPNYSFHVPLKSSAGFRRHLHPTGMQTSLQRPMSGGRSRTIAHLPLIDADQSSDEADEPDGNRFSADSHCYEDFYERPESQAEARRLNCGQYLMLSEGDLLRVRQPMMGLRQQLEQDNPFRPGTELSWEADLMVRLIQRGYPIQELPQLVAAAKEVAAASSELAPETKLSRSGTLPACGAKLGDKDKAGSRETPTRGKSACDLSSSGKRVWANSLQRAKSMPRVLRNKDSANDDDDSLDRLITSIEQEIGCPMVESKATSDKIGAKATDRKQSREVIGADDGTAKIRSTKMVRKNKITTVASTSNSKKKLTDCCVVQ